MYLTAYVVSLMYTVYVFSSFKKVI